MSLKYETPKVLTATDMFLWWAKNKIKNKRHLKIRYSTSNSRDTILVSTNREELNWLRKHVLVLAEQIDNLERTDNEKGYFTIATRSIYEKKGEIYRAEERIKHLQQVNLDNSHKIMSESLFRDIIGRFNSKVRDRLINNGSVINMKNYMGFLYIQKITRNDPRFTSKSSRMPNWIESKKYRQELIDKGIQVKDDDHPDGKKWVVYFDDEFYIKYTWAKNKGACRVKNHTYYSFNPCGGENGSKKQLSNTNIDNPYLHKIYTHRKIYYPKLNPNNKRI